MNKFGRIGLKLCMHHISDKCKQAINVFMIGSWASHRRPTVHDKAALTPMS